MANPLTGNHEGVVQIAVRQISGLLGALHQNALIQQATLKLLHSATLRIGDPPRRRPDLDVLGDWLFERQRKGPGRSLKDVRANLTATAPPGAARLLTDAFAELDLDLSVEVPPDVVRGLAKVQVSTLAISVPNGSSSEVIVSAGLRMSYYPDPGTTDLPAPLHGELSAAFDVQRISAASGTRLTVKPSAQDAKIQFIPAPGAGLDPAEVSRITAEIRKVLRQGVSQTPVDLPSDFPFADLKGLGSGANQIIALPVQLSGAAPPAGGTQGLMQSFVGASGFAIAVSKEYVSSLIDIEAIRASIRQQPARFTFNTILGSVSFEYRLSFSSGPTLTFKSGGFEISGRVDAVTDSWAPNGFVSFRQMIHLTLDPVQQTVRLVRAGDPAVDKSWFIPLGKAVDIVKTEIDKALAANASGVSRVFNDGRSKLTRGIRTFDTSATVSYSAIEVTPDGVIVRGDIGSAPRRAPVLKVAETHRGTAFTALESWIPAGRIDRFVWSWVEYSGPATSIFSGTQKTLTDQHRFILPKPAGVTSVDRICLRIEGTRIAPNGHTTSVTAGATCHVQEPEFALDLPSWWGPLVLPIWQPDLNDSMPLRDAIAGHISVQADVPRKQPFSRNTLVAFADWSAARPLEALHHALSKTKNAALMVIVVVPEGAFDRSRKEFESKLPGEGFAVPVQFTEDDQGAWTRAFAVSKTPSVYLVNAAGEFVWKQEVAVDGTALAEAFDKHPVPKRTPEFAPLKLSIAPGDGMLDALFVDDRAQTFELHRFRGRDVILTFWQSWSAPCMKELARLQQLHQTGKDTPFIAGFHGGSNSKALDETRKRLGLSFSLVQDQQQRIARSYGVRCWPTTIMIDAEGHVQHIQLGTEHEHDKPRVLGKAIDASP